jgi:hypothetical protein
LPFKRQRAYPVNDAPVPWSRATWYRWEKAGVIPPLPRIGGHTLVTDELIDDLLSGKIAVPPHPRRLGHAQIQPKTRKGRPRKKQADESLTGAGQPP